MSTSSNLDIAVKIAQEAGKILLKHFGKVKTVSSKSNSASDVVTKFDRDIEEFIAQKLQRHDASIGFVGEEHGVKNKPKKFWLVDPIDGTAHFIRGIPICTTMIALVDKGQVKLSVIYNFVSDELFTAQKGKGAKLNGKPIYVSKNNLKKAYISVESKLRNKTQVQKFTLLNQASTLFHTVTCGFEFGLIASGKLDGRICLDPYGDDYDYAAGSLLIKEAGGIVANIGKRSYNYRNHNFIATNKIIYEELTKGNNPIFSLR